MRRRGSFAAPLGLASAVLEAPHSEAILTWPTTAAWNTGTLQTCIDSAQRGDTVEIARRSAL